MEDKNRDLDNLNDFPHPVLCCLEYGPTQPCEGPQAASKGFVKEELEPNSDNEWNPTTTMYVAAITPAQDIRRHRNKT